MSHQSDLFFFDQCFRRRTYKRYRKPQELLPFSLRLTGLSGAVKVEAYLKQQQKAAESKDGQHVKSFTTDKDNNEASETTPRKDGDFAVAEGGKKLQAGQTFNLPEISTRGISSLPLIRNFEQLEGDDEEEDTQRFLFEENKFAAPNLLAQLGRLISQLHEQQLEELDEIQSSSGQFYNRSATPPLDREQQSLYSDTIRRGGVVISLPDDLYKRLRGNFEELSASAVYVHREWQTTSYKEQAILLKRLEMMNDSQVILGQSKSHEKTDQNKSHEAKLSSVRNTETNSKEHSLRKVSTVDATAKADSASDLRREVALGVNTPTTDTGGHAEIPSRQESAKPAFAPNRPNKTRIERLKGYSEKLLSEKKRLPTGAIDEDEDQKDIAEGYSNHGIAGQPTVINFSLLSKTCEDKGWILHRDDASDLERQTLLEWARGRLQQVIREKEEIKEKAKELGIDGPLITKYYGDTQREVALKYKKGVSWAKRWMKLSDEDKRPKFLTSLPDGTSYCYYPSGRTAICTSYSGPNLPGKYTIVFGDSSVSPMLAAFVPSGQGCCYHKNGNIRFISGAKFGAIMEDDGKVDQKWKWPLGRLQTTVTVQLNNFISLRCVSQTAMTLYFNCQSETAKFPVGMAQGAKPVKLLELGFLQTNMDFSSNAAFLSMKPRVKKKEEKRRRRVQKARDKDGLTEEVLEQRQQELEEKFPERKELDLDAPWQMDLLKLQRKVKGLIYEWMEHYRVAVGISQPFRISMRANRRAMSHSARSVPGVLPSGFETRRSSFRRTPSAPPVASPKGSPRDPSSTMVAKQSHSFAEKARFGGIVEDFRGITLVVPTNEMLGSRTASNPVSTALGQSSPVASSRTPFRCGVIQQPRTAAPRSGCPVALRAEMLGEAHPQCRCDRRKIPLVTDLEYDSFISEHVPRTQLLVVSVTSSLYPDSNPCDGMLDQLFHEKSRNRSLPCVQAQNDPFRLVRYDISTASRDLTHSQPLLLRRHNAVPGMFLMYTGGKLLFADHIFNGYGNAKKDFLKQITRTRKDALEGKALPSDFRLSPIRGRSGPRAAWGGEIGGVRISDRALSVSPVASEIQVYQGNLRIDSAATSGSLGSASFEIRSGSKSAASFINLGLSIDSPFPLQSANCMKSTETIPTIPEHRRLQTKAW
ncbi:uncharacterized protein [Acropora muricata]|uniref:uncharacterized protein n=1 Tax=Acropora muricata TaxID=159855 RepID=UPI0034E3AF31